MGEIRLPTSSNSNLHSSTKTKFDILYVCSIIMCSLIFRNQCTPLLLAATSGALDTIKYLFSLGANWRKTDIKGNNIIHLSVLTFHTEVLKYIIELNIPELPVWKTLVGEYRARNLFINKCSDYYSV